jgi:peptide-methionine (R)-S-oxide reductase
MITRRLLATTGLFALAVSGGLRWAVAAGAFEFARTNAEWHRRLSGDQYAVLRKGGTERPYAFTFG